MKLFSKILYYTRISLFIVSLLLIFLTMKNYIKVGLFGYIFFIFEFMYIITMLFTLLSKKIKYMTDLAFNIMHLGTYIYQIILSLRMFNFKISSLVLDSYTFYINNYIILSILLLTLIFYTIVLYGEIKQKNNINNLKEKSI